MLNSNSAYVIEGKIFRKGFRDFPDRQIGEIKTEEAASIAYFKDRFLLAEKKVEALEKDVEAAENKGSYLMRLIHLKEHLASFDAIGDFESLYGRLENIEGQLKALIAKNRISNLAIKKELIAEAEALEGSENWKEDTEKFKDLKSRWIKTGNVEKEYEEALNNRFSSIVDVFFDKRQAFYKAKYREVQNKVYQLKQIIRNAKIAVRKPSYEARNELKMLQEEWKRIGKVPDKSVKILNREFESICNKVFRQGGSFARNEDIAQVLKEKGRMVEQAKELSSIQTPSEAHIEEVRLLQKAWKQKKAIPQEQNKALAKAFYNACNLTLERHFVNNLAKERYKNFDTISAQEQLQIKIQLLRDLLARDERELATFQENLGKVNVRADGTHKMVHARYSQQIRKVFTKKGLLEAFENELERK